MHWALPCGADVIFDRNAYLKNYRCLIDYMAEHGFECLIIWGFIRQSHGGEAAAQELCAYAKVKGVKLMAGVGVNSYGGFAYGGPHPYSLDTFLEKNKHLRAVGRDGAPVYWRWPEGIDFSRHTNACASQPEVRQWFETGLRWFLKNFDLAGIQIETGDIGTACHCKTCLERVGDRSKNPVVSFEDMATVLPPVVNLAHSLRPDLMVICCMYKPWSLERMDAAKLLAKHLSPQAICQWGYPHAIKTLWLEQNGQMTVTDVRATDLDIYKKTIKPPTARNTFDLGYGGHHPMWGVNGAPHHSYIRDACLCAERLGLDGLKIYGEISDNFDGSGRQRFNEINYLAFAEFSRNPLLSVEEFEKKYRNQLGTQKWNSSA